jgi:hypothetical protein
MSVMALALRYWREVIVIAAIAVLGVSCHARDVARADAAVQADRAKALEVILAQHSHESARLDTIVQRDTLRLTKALTHFDTVRATVNIHDTVEVLRFIAATDATVRTCRETTADFAASCASKDVIIADLQKKIAQQVGATVPAASGTSWRERAVWFSLGAEAHQLLIHPPRR